MAGMSFEGVAVASSRRPWITIGLWVALLAVAITLNATLLQDALTTEFSFSNEPDSLKADRLLEDKLRGPRAANELVVVQSTNGLTVDDAEFQSRVGSLFAEISALGPEVIVRGANFQMEGLPPGAGEGFVSQDRKTTFMSFVMKGSLDDAVDNVEGILEIVRTENGKDGFKVLMVGDASIAFESNELAVSDIEQGERIGVPIALLILLVLFGAVIAALIPIGLAIVSIIVALGATSIVGQLFDLVFFVTLMITMIGLAVGIDYSLIVISRFREELRRGHDKHEAVARTGATASRTVFFSGITVMFALFGMIVIPATVFQSLEVGAILVVVAAVAATLTLLPAVLVLLGTRINALTLPFIGRRSRASIAVESTGGFWGFVTRTVMGRPVISLILVAGLMIAAAVSLLDLNTGFNGVDSFPDKVQAKEAFLIVDEEFSFGVAAPTEVVIDGDASSAQVLDGIENLTGLLGGDAAFNTKPVITVNEAGDLTLFSTGVAGEVSSAEAVEAVRKLRETYVPQAFGPISDDVFVTGFTAFNIDFFDMTDTFTPIVFAVVLGLSFVLLTIVFRSIIVPLKAIVMNLLSVGAAYGLIVLVFQKGYGADILGFQKSEIIDAWIPLFLFSVLFGLSMDYHVFLLSRVRERYDQTKQNAEAVAYGLRATAGLITGAALIMVAVFSGFAMGETVSNQQVGFGLAVAVLIDATLVRSVLVPATMRLLGDWNWYLPPFLHWLPDLRVEAEEPAPVPAATKGSTAGQCLRSDCAEWKIIVRTAAASAYGGGWMSMEDGPPVGTSEG